MLVLYLLCCFLLVGWVLSSVRLEAGHVVNLQRQVFARSLPQSCGVSLLCNYASQCSFAYQDALGAALLGVGGGVPGGVLVFFPSYGLLDRVRERERVGESGKTNQ